MKDTLQEKKLGVVAEHQPRDGARPIRRIVVRPEQVIQHDERPWKQTTLTQIVVGFLVISALVVAFGVGALAIGLGRIL